MRLGISWTLAGSLAALTLASGCGLFFEGEPGQGGAGTGGTGTNGTAVSATGVGTGGAGGSGVSVSVGSGGGGGGGGSTEWLLSFADARLDDLTTGPTGQIFFAGVAKVGAPGGLPFPAGTTMVERLFVARVEPDGTGLVVWDLGGSTNAAVRLSHGDGPRVHVAWTQARRFCATPVDDNLPDAGFPSDCGQAPFRCQTSVTSTMSQPGFAESKGGTAPDQTIATFKVGALTTVTCSAPSQTFSTALNGTVVALRGGPNPQALQVDAVDQLRLSTAGDIIHATGHCLNGGTTPGGGPSCNASPFALFQVDLDPTVPAFENGGALQLFTGETVIDDTYTAFPSPGPNAYTVWQSSGANRRAIHWSAAPVEWAAGSLVGSSTQTGPDATAVRSAEIVDGRLLLTGVTDLPLPSSGIECEGGVVDCGPMAFWAEAAPTMGTIVGAKGYQVLENPGCTEGRAAASGGFIRDDSVFFGGTYACGALKLGAATGIDAGTTKNALFVARVPAP